MTGFRRQILLQQQGNTDDENPDWEDPEIYVLERLSPVFELEVLRLFGHQRYTWRLQHHPSQGFDHRALSLFSEVVRVRRGCTTTTREQPEQDFATETPSQRASRVNRALASEVPYTAVKQTASRLCGYSNLLWFYQVVPSRLYVPWVVILEGHNQTKEIAKAPSQFPGPIIEGHEVLLKTADGVAIALAQDTTSISACQQPLSPKSDTGKHPTQHWTSKALRKEANHWCWNVRTTHGSRETSLPLAITSLIHGWKEMFQAEIITVIWDWPRVTEYQCQTPIVWLQHDELQSHRQAELKGISGYLQDYVENNEPPKAIKSARELKSRMNDSSEDHGSGSIYSWITDFQLAMGIERPRAPNAPTHSKKRSETSQSGHGSANSTNGSHDAEPAHHKNSSSRNPFRGGRDDQPGFGEGAIVAGKDWLHKKDIEKADKNYGWLVAMFKGLDVFIRTRQEKLSTKMMIKRDQQVKIWEDELKMVECHEAESDEGSFTQEVLSSINGN